MNKAQQVTSVAVAQRLIFDWVLLGF